MAAARTSAAKKKWTKKLECPRMPSLRPLKAAWNLRRQERRGRGVSTGSASVTAPIVGSNADMRIPLLMAGGQSGITLPMNPAEGKPTRGIGLRSGGSAPKHPARADARHADQAGEAFTRGQKVWQDNQVDPEAVGRGVVAH